MTKNDSKDIPLAHDIHICKHLFFFAISIFVNISIFSSQQILCINLPQGHEVRMLPFIDWNLVEGGSGHA